MTNTPPPPPPVTTVVSASDSKTLTGYVIGVGAETMLAPNIGTFVQVLHYGFADENFSLLGSTVNVSLDETVVEAGINFYFN